MKINGKKVVTPDVTKWIWSSYATKAYAYERTQLKIELFPTPPWHFDRL